MKRRAWTAHVADVTVVNSRIADPAVDSVFLVFSVPDFKGYLGVARVQTPFKQGMDVMSAGYSCQVRAREGWEERVPCLCGRCGKGGRGRVREERGWVGWGGVGRGAGWSHWLLALLFTVPLHVLPYSPTPRAASGPAAAVMQIEWKRVCELTYAETRIIRNLDTGEPVAKTKSWQELPARTGQLLLAQMYRAVPIGVDPSSIEIRALSLSSSSSCVMVVGDGGVGGFGGSVYGVGDAGGCGGGGGGGGGRERQGTK
jgi:hypothetical protein